MSNIDDSINNSEISNTDSDDSILDSPTENPVENNTPYVPSLDEIFAIRISIQDYTDDEFTIIKRLKLYLQDKGMIISDINNFLVDFYNSFDMPFTLEDIEQINVDANNLLSMFLTGGNIQMAINENNPDENINITSLLENINSNTSVQDNNINVLNNNLPVLLNDIQTVVPSNMILESELNIFNTLLNYLNTHLPMEPFPMPPLTEHYEYDEDVLVTLDEDELNKLNKLNVTEKQDSRCTICLMDIDVGESMIKLGCSHSYHSECLEKYLKEYDYKCPVCRADVGKSYAHL